MEQLLDYLFICFDKHDSRNCVSMSCSSVHHYQLEQVHDILVFIRDNVDLSSEYKSKLDFYCSRSIAFHD